MPKNNKAKAKHERVKPVVYEYKTGNEGDAAQALQHQINNEIVSGYSAEEQEKFSQLQRKIQTFNANFLRGGKLESNIKTKESIKKDIEDIIKWFKDSGLFAVHSTFNQATGWIVSVEKTHKTITLRLRHNPVDTLEQAMRQLTTTSEDLSTTALTPSPALLLSERTDNSVALSAPEPETGEQFNLNFWKRP